jgi:tyrosyl-tRNA synthetase
MLMQGYDFLALNRKYNCTLQLGGDDQWSNILGGADLIRRVEGKEAYGMTFTLLTTSEGKKMGKTQKGALWLDSEKTTPYEFYQYFRNVGDDDVIKCLKLLTFIPIEEIEAMEKTLSGSNINKAKELLAYSVTALVHGEENAKTAQKTARDLFTGSADSENMPSGEIFHSDFTDGKITVIDILVKTKLAPSKGEARRLIEQGGITVNDEKITALDANLSEKDFEGGHIIVKKGKKVFFKVVLN